MPDPTPAVQLERLRVQLKRRTTEWQDEQAARLKAEQATIAADQRAKKAEQSAHDAKHRTRLVHETLRKYAFRLAHIPTHDGDARVLIQDAATELRTIADLTSAAAGEDAPGAIVCGRGHPAPTGTAQPATRVYVAGPYSADPEACVQAAIDAADQLLHHGHAPLVPHLKHPWITQTGHSYEAWLALDMAWVEAADVVLRLPGESPGADREVAHARAHGIPVVDSLDELPARQEDVPACRVCGCTDEAACPGGCHWIPDPTGAGDLCDRCDGAVLRVTVEDLDNGDRACRGVPAGNYVILATDPCTYDLTPFPGGLHQIVVKNINEGNDHQ